MPLQLSFKQETKINRRDHEIFYEKATGSWKISLYDPLGYEIMHTPLPTITFNSFEVKGEPFIKFL